MLRWRSWWSGIVALAVAVSAAAGEAVLTLDDIFGSELYSDTVASELLWLPDGSGFLFRDARDGVDGLWQQDVASGETRLVVDWGALDKRLAAARPDFVAPSPGDVNVHPGVGFEETLSPDGRSYLGSASGDLFLLNLATGNERFLTANAAPERFATFSPDGSRVAFVRDNDLWLVEVATGVERRLTDRGGNQALQNGVADWVYEEELDVQRSFWWSPDGSSILLAQYDTSPETLYPILDERGAQPVVEWQRYPRAGEANATVRLGVLPVAGGAVAWVDTTDLGDGYLARAGWLPSGTGVWYETLDRKQDRLELRFVDPLGSAGRTVLVEQDPAWVNVRDDLLFVDRERFLWASERDGFRHLYLYASDGSLIRRLTSGAWQVEQVYGLDAARARVFFQATERDWRGRNVYSVALDGSGFTCLTPTPGTHDASLAPDGAHLLDTFSTLSTPPRLDLCDAGGKLVRTVDDGAIPALASLDLVPPELGSLRAEDGTELSTFTYLPPKLEAGRRYPALLYVYGGPGTQVVTNAWDDRRGLFFQLMARKGLVVFALDNRGSGGRGHAFEAVLHRRLGEVEVADQLAGVRHLAALPFVDSRRIGVYGGSYGGYMTLLLMLRAPELFAAGIAYAPVTDWRLYDTIFTERYMGTPQDNPDGYRESAPLLLADKLQGRLLICHGAMDNNVHLANTVQMELALLKADKLLETVLFPGVRHGIRVSSLKLPFHRLKLDFLERQLIGNGGPPAP